jgi:hypothetical protein
MHLIVACGLCGGDPTTDTMLVSSGIAAVLSGPILFRSQMAAVIRRLRGQPPREADTADEACPLPSAEDDQP